LGWALKGLQRADIAVELGGVDGFNLHADSPEWPPWDNAVRDAQADATLVVLSGAFLYGVTSAGRWRTACHPAWDSAFELALARRLQDLQAAPGELWVATVPYPLGPYDKREFREQVDCINGLLREALHEVPRLRTLELAKLVCPSGNCSNIAATSPVRPDGVHFDLVAARSVAEGTLAALR
jgi:hypothetical protein